MEPAFTQRSPWVRIFDHVVGRTFGLAHVAKNPEKLKFHSSSRAINNLFAESDDDIIT